MEVINNVPANTDSPKQDGGSGSQFFTFLIIALTALLVYLFVVYGLPALRNTDQVEVNNNFPQQGQQQPAPQQPAPEQPAPEQPEQEETEGTPDINIPETIDINLNQNTPSE